ncbi:rhomboid-related protein 3-like isoform X1 [Ptychodera flava]|uniref:rhomboid-related protein 3-like isoform X1 n=1 Tax=Ptychodera flava TaxID=63121 RepID=UPI003969C3DF
MISMHTVIDSSGYDVESDGETHENGKNAGMGGSDGLPLLDLPQSLEDRWKPLFDQFDEEGNGVISMGDFDTILNHYGLRNELDQHKLNRLKTTIEENRDGYISYQEFVNVMSEKRTLSFSIAVRDGDYDESCQSRYNQLSCRQKMLKNIADEVLTNNYDRKTYVAGYSCCPPPIFMIFISCLEIGVYAFYAMDAKRGVENDEGIIENAEVDYLTGPIPENSPFLYKPAKRLELWRFITYILIHAGLEHLLFNIVIQLILGVPLEMVHGAVRVGSIYFVGVLAGSLGTSVLDMQIYLCGASGGSYALLAGHLANVILNFSEMHFGILRLILVFLLASVDVGFAIWRRYAGRGIPTAYVAHFSGAVVGATIGLLVLRTTTRNSMNVS